MAGFYFIIIGLYKLKGCFVKSILQDRGSKFDLLLVCRKSLLHKCNLFFSTFLQRPQANIYYNIYACHKLFLFPLID